NTLAPWRAAAVAASKPAGPPPNTTTSYSPNKRVLRAGSCISTIHLSLGLDDASAPIGRSVIGPPHSRNPAHAGGRRALYTARLQLEAKLANQRSPTLELFVHVLLELLGRATNSLHV